MFARRFARSAVHRNWPSRRSCAVARNKSKMLFISGDNLINASSVQAAEASGGDYTVDLCTCGYANCSAKTRTELLPMTESLRESARKSKLRAGTKGLAEGNQPHMLDAAQLIYLAWGDVTQKTIARCWARASTLPEHHQAKLTGGSATASIHEEGIPDMESLSAAVDDLSRMLLAIDNAKTDPYAVELIGTLSELGVEPGSTPDQNIVNALAEWAVVEDRKDITDTLRAMQDIILGMNRQNVATDPMDYEKLMIAINLKWQTTH